MRNSFAAMLAAAAILLAGAGDADATRPIVKPPVDRCDDLRGMQDDGSRGVFWRWKVKTPERGDCRRLSPLKSFG